MSETLVGIYWAFFRIYLIAFGGVFVVLPELEQSLVAQHAWVTHEQFIQAFVLGQFLPGPNMAMCPLLGYWIYGWAGFTAAFFGIYAGPFVLMGVAANAYTRFKGLRSVRRLELALRPVVTGLLVASLAHFAVDQAVGIGSSVWLARGLALLVAALAYYFFRVRRVSSLVVILVSGVAWLGLSMLFR